MTGCTGEATEPRSSVSPQRGTLEGQPAAVIRARGKLRDLSAAVNRALDTRELAMLQVTTADQTGSRMYELVGLRGETGHIRVDFAPWSGNLADLREPRDMMLTARLGVLGDPKREADMLRAVAGELEALAKREF